MSYPAKLSETKFLAGALMPFMTDNLRVAVWQQVTTSPFRTQPNSRQQHMTIAYCMLCKWSCKFILFSQMLPYLSSLYHLNQRFPLFHCLMVNEKCMLLTCLDVPWFTSNLFQVERDPKGSLKGEYMHPGLDQQNRPSVKTASTSPNRVYEMWVNYSMKHWRSFWNGRSSMWNVLNRTVSSNAKSNVALKTFEIHIWQQVSTLFGL